MRLLNATSLKLCEFSGKNIPEYAILSHTWGEDEVLFQHMQDATAESCKGWSKVQGCCDQARRDGWTYVWIDTCCINKSSSAEFSEAINSMYQWYQESAICYAFLADVRATEHDKSRLDGELICSRWFKRGWTLQELLAPQQVLFYNRYWEEIGTKFSLSQLIEEVTGIDQFDFIYPKESSCAQKMCWAASRETTRIEDIAYCLMGLFDVNMPLLYREGQRAFTRLQYEIISKSRDDSLFAWSSADDDSSTNMSMLASSPKAFKRSGKIVSWHTLSLPLKSSTIKTLTQTNVGLRMDLVMRFVGSDFNQEYEALLDCGQSGTKKRFVIILGHNGSKGDILWRKGEKWLSYQQWSKVLTQDLQTTASERNKLLESKFEVKTVYTPLPTVINEERYISHAGTLQVQPLWSKNIGPPTSSYEIRMNWRADNSDELEQVDSTSRVFEVSSYVGLALKWRSPGYDDNGLSFVVFVRRMEDFLDVKLICLPRGRNMRDAVEEVRKMYDDQNRTNVGIYKSGENASRLPQDRDRCILPNGDLVTGTVKRIAHRNLQNRGPDYGSEPEKYSLGVGIKHRRDNIQPSPTQ